MIDRYRTPEMAEIWADSARLHRWRRVELAVLEARASHQHETVSAEEVEAARRTPAPTVEAVAAEEARVGHDVIAFIDAWTSTMPDATAAAVHADLTSSDIVDTAQALALKEAAALITAAACDLIVSLCDRSLALSQTLCVARTHGQPAALTVIGHRFADFAFAADRALSRLRASTDLIGVAKLSGPVGTGVGLSPEIVAAVSDQLGLAVPPVTTQVVFRDAIAMWICDLATLGAVCEAIATDVRLGQHDGVGELLEGLGLEQEGSSAMPHKANPIGAENIGGLARLLRGYVGPVLEDVALWQHRDITHSSVERIVLPDASALAETVLLRTRRLVNDVVVDFARVDANIERAGALLASSRLQSRAQMSRLRRKDAARAVRTVLAETTATGDFVEKAGAEVLASTEIARIFTGVTDLRNRYRN